MLRDKVMLEIFKNRFQAITDEMGYNILRTGHTVFVKETADFGTALVSLEGEVFAAPLHLGISVMIGMPMLDAINSVATYEEGDIVLTNDPYATRGLVTHLPDLYVWKPIFHEGRLVCFAMAFIHSSDVGGKVPGSISPTSSDIFQEGIRLPPFKLYDRGQLNRTVLDVFLANCRIPDQNWGDIKALVGAMHTADRRMQELITRYGAEEVSGGISGLLDYGERQARELISQLPDGDYRFSDYLEGDVAGGFPLRLELTMQVRGADITLDFTGTDPQVQAAFNLPSYCQRGHYMIVPAIVNYFRTIDPNIPYNSGLVRPIAIEAEPGSLVNPDEGMAVGVRAATMFRIWEMTMATLSQADPRYVPAAGAGQACIVLLACPDVQTGRLRISVAEPLCGGSGGRPTKDGIDGADFSSYIRNIPVEVLETDMPVRVHRYRLRPGSGGAGRFRGGNGVDFTFENLAPYMILTARGMERFRFRPWGRSGGAPGSLGRTVLNPGTAQEREIGRIDVLELDTGDVLQFLTPAGGGYGRPTERDPVQVLQDLQSGSAGSLSEVAEAYGVVTRQAEQGFELDRDETSKQRTEMYTSDNAPEFSFGPERDEYDSRWGEDVRRPVREFLGMVPTRLRDYIKRKIYRVLESEVQRSGAITEDALVQALQQARAALGTSH